MSDGLSYESFAAIAGVTLKTMYNWEKQFPNWKEAKEMGRPHQILWWEKLNQDAARGDLEDAKAALIIFSLKNIAGWRDKQDIDVGGKDGAPGIKVIIEDYVTGGKAKNAKQ